ncbi:MAG: cation:proton antiporter, partial [Chloroflexi bacterium]|nr:cation:proton antiporter [Chloroflexota bacterium]
IFTVLVLVLLPALALPLGGESTAGLAAALSGGEGLALTLALAVGKTVAFTLLMLFVGARAVPWLLVKVAETNSRELFTLLVLVLALGIAFASSALFGVSLALGAFLAGVVVGESDLSHQAAAEALPLRDAFAVLFFVSVGMLFDPSFILTDFARILAVLGIIVLAKPLAAAAIVALFGYSLRASLTIAAGLAQIGEFSFILADLGRTLGLLPAEGYNLVLAGALLSITINPFLFRAIEPVEAWIRRHPKLAAMLERSETPLTEAGPEADTHALRGHAVICGYGRVGSIIGHALERRGLRYVAVDLDRRRIEGLRQRGVPSLFGDAANPALLEHAALDHARILVVAAPDPIAARRIVEMARRTHPRLDIIVRTHSAAEREFLSEHGANEAVIGELELALEMARHTLHRFGVSGLELQSSIQGLRRWGEETEPALS